MGAQPELVFSSLMQEANALQRLPRPDAIKLARLKSSATKLRTADPYGAFTLLGILAAIEKNQEEMYRNHTAAMRLHPREVVAIRNFATSLYNMNLYSEARERMLEAYEQDPSSLDSIDHLIKYLGASGYFREAQRMLEQREKLNPEFPHQLRSTIQEAANFLDRSAISEADVEAMEKTAIAVAHSKRCYCRHFTFNVVGDEESHWLSARFSLEADLNEIAEINAEVANALSELSVGTAAAAKVNILFLSGGSDSNAGFDR